MPYGSIYSDAFQGSTANTAPVIYDGNSREIGQFTKSWVNFNGTGTIATRASFNVSSLTDHNTGDYTVSYTINMSDANYSAVGMTDFTTSFVVSMNSTSSAPAVGSLRINNRTSAAGAADSSYIFLAVNR